MINLIGVGDCWLNISSTLINARLHTETYLCTLPRSVFKSLCGGVGWVVEEIKLSDRLWQSFSLSLGKPNNYVSDGKSAKIDVKSMEKQITDQFTSRGSHSVSSIEKNLFCNTRLIKSLQTNS